MQFFQTRVLSVAPSVEDVMVCGLKYNVGSLEQLSSGFFGLRLPPRASNVAMILSENSEN